MSVKTNATTMDGSAVRKKTILNNKIKSKQIIKKIND